MDSRFSVQAGASHGILNHYVLQKHASSLFSLTGIDIEGRARIAVLLASLTTVFLIFVIRRVISGIPFFPPKDYRSFTVFNKSAFLALYDKDALPSKAPIEPLEGSRLWWSRVQVLCLVALVAVNGVLLGRRAANGNDATDEAIECIYWVALSAVSLLRLMPTPYRTSCFVVIAVFSLVPSVLVVERDIWPKLLMNPSRDQINDARQGWEVYAKLALSLAVPTCALLTPRLWYPVDPYSNDEASPEQTASLFSYIVSYTWIQSLVVTAWSRDIEVKDLPRLPDYDRALLWSKKVAQSQKSSAFKTLLSLMRVEVLAMTFLSVAVGAAQFIWPLSMKELLSYVEKSKSPTITPWVWVFGLFMGPIIHGLVWEGYVFTATRLIVRVKAAFTQSLLQKTLKIRFAYDETKDEQEGKRPKLDNKSEKQADSPNQSKVGKINNLMSTDIEQLTNAREFFLIVGSVPIEVAFAMAFLYNLLGWSSIVGVSLMVVAMIVPIVLARTLARVQKKLRQATDVRIGLMTETLNAVRIVKYFGLESAFDSKIKQSRENELRLSLISAIYNLGFHSISTTLPIINMIVTFGLFTKVQGQPLTASVAFTAISLFDILRSQFGWMAFVTQQVLYAFVSFDRIDKFLNEEEELVQSTVADDNSESLRGPAFQNATLSWEVPGSDADDHFRLSNLNTECPFGELTVIAGPVGSGKSSFLLGLLEEMRILKGRVYLPRKRGIAYASQSPWLQNETIQDNILFGNPYDEARYNMVLEACGLATDIRNLEAGDQTEVGEKGVTLSGGQKARLSLARAVYSPAQTLFLDDILSALDAGTSKIIVDKCIKGRILRGRTVVLVTHHVSLVSSAAKKIIHLEEGRIVSDCAPEEMSYHEIQDLDGPAPEEETRPSLAEELLAATVRGDPRKNEKSGKLITEEGHARGRVDIRTLWKYLKYCGGPLVLLFLGLLSISDQLGGLAQTFYIGLWADKYNTDPKHVDVNLWLGVYAAVLLGTNLLDTLTYGVWFTFQWMASRRIHEKLIKSVLHSPIRFFDVTPMGRIINRLSNDVKSIDSRIGPYFMQVFHQCLDVGFRLVVMSGLIPAFLVPTVAVSIIGIACGSLYARAQVGVKRIVSIKESPLFSHFGDSIAGIVTIRAFGVQQRFLDESMRRVDAFSQPNEAFFGLNRWIGVRISWCTSLIGLVTGVISMTLSSKYSPGLLGFSMSNALAFSSAILFSVRYFNILEVEMNCWERVNEYMALEQEEPAVPQKEPPAAWPTEGDVQVRDLTVKYSEDGPDVLHKISFEIKPRERVGVVGRTGAGKSSLALSLLRFTHISNGSITVNGIDTKDVNLETLRRRITIIPQDPILFSGTIRTNLDPFGEVDDSELQAALEGSGLAGTKPDNSSSGENTPVVGTMSSMPAKRITLDTPITAGGNNLSQGQRQLLAFARALVRRSKLLILDEATSSTDMKTDDMIQETIRTSFADSSLITIAHRLRTVASFDRIIVLDNLGKGGEVVEFDTPLNLLKREGGVLHSLAQKSGEYEELLAIASKGKW